MSYRELAGELGDEFVSHPLDFVTEVDLQVRLVDLLRRELSEGRSRVRDPILEDTPSSYKEEYWKEIQERLKKKGEIDRVHTEASVKQGERLDVAVFSREIENRIRWVSSGSKRFSTSDIDAVFELKFIKNKYKFPTKKGVTRDELQKKDPPVDDLISDLDFSENKIESDVKELNRLDDVSNRFFLLFSNNNYLFGEPVTEPEQHYKYGDLYAKMGTAARKWISDNLDQDVGFLYVHPKAKQWI